MLVALPGEELLRECGALVRRGRFVPDEQDASFVALRTKRLRGAGAGEAGAHDHHGSLCHAACTSTTEMAPIGQASAASMTASS